MVGNQAIVRESDLGLVALCGDFKGDFRAVPLALVFYKIQGAFHDKPDDFLARDEFRYFLFAVVVRVVAIGKLIAEFAGATFDSRFACPPSPNVVDRSEDFCRSLVYRKCGREILVSS